MSDVDAAAILRKIAAAGTENPDIRDYFYDIDRLCVDALEHASDRLGAFREIGIEPAKMKGHCDFGGSCVEQ